MNKSTYKSESEIHEEIFRKSEIIIKDFEAGKYDNEPDARKFLEDYMEKHNIKKTKIKL